MSILASTLTLWFKPFQTIILEQYWYTIATAAENAHSGNTTNINHFLENILLETAFFIKIVIECIALIILTFAILKSIQKLPSMLKRSHRQQNLLSLRLDLGMALALSLEFLLAADIAATAISPSWDALGKLATISAIRTFLNFFLQKEVKELEAEKLEQLTD